VPLHILLSGSQRVERELLNLMMDSNLDAVHSEGNNYLMWLSRSGRTSSQKEDIALDLIQLGVDPLQRKNKGEFFYAQIKKTHSKSGLKIEPHIDNLGMMDKVHLQLSGWRTIHFAISKGDLRLVRALRGKDHHYRSKRKKYMWR
jgi:hypothetical protein